jgi:DeoR/GlpR family transcriptional regulator of sugar metabolism
MLQSQRHEKILNVLRERGYLSVPEAVSIFASSPATIRRDFTLLCRAKLLRRVRGGVGHIDSGADPAPFPARENIFTVEKRRIAAKAVSLIKSGDVVFVCGGTTTFHIAACLTNIDIRLITNSVRLAAALDLRKSEIPNVEIYLSGGFMYAKSGMLLGPSAENSFGMYHADLAFIPAEGVSAEGVFNSNELVVGIEQAMLRNASKTIVLADHSKLGHKAMCRICRLEETDSLITDEFDAAAVEEIKQRGVTVVTV